MKIKGKVYYAHSKRIYGTPREKAEFKYLNKKCADEVVCPNNDMGELGAMEPYLKMVRSCEVVVCSEFKKHIGKGVYEEVAEGLRKRRQVYVLRKGVLGFKLKKVNGVELADETDWKVYYAKVCN